MSQVTAREIAERLAEQAEKVAKHLLGSEGQRKGHELCYGDLSGSPGKSVSIHLTGSKAGLWGEFNGGEAGDLLGLWQAARNCDIYTAIQEAKEYLGIRDVKLTGKRPEAKVIPRPEGVRPLGPGAIHWLREERKLSPEAVAAYKLVSQGTNVVGFPLLLPNGDLVGMKFRKLNEDFYWAATDASKVLFGWHAIPADARRVVICEGELKALAWWDYGFPALSIPFGGGGKGKQDWIEIDYDRLARFDIIYLALDQDAAGKEASDAIMQRLGPERCAVVELPLPAEPGAKCINSCVKHGVSRAAIQQAVLKAKPRDPDELKSAGDYADEVAAMFAIQGPESGIRTPWKKVGDDLVFRAGELTVIAGINGHGKSQAVGFMAAAAMRDGFRVCVASLEFKVAGWLKRLVRQFAARSDVSERYAKAIVRWLGDGALWAFDAQGTTDWKRMLEVFRYARRRYGIELFVIDNLTGLGIGEEDYQGQKALALALANFCRDEECHVWLVHHIRKTNSEHGQPDKMDIKGSGAITDLASTVLTVWRNKAKEAKKKEADMTRQPMDPEEAKKPDVRITCSKQRNYTRNGNGEPAIALWWDADAYHYLAKQDHTPRPLLPRGWDDEPATQPP
jgi:twinkle protein